MRLKALWSRDKPNNQDALLLHAGSDAAPSRRDSVRRRLLATSDVMALTLAWAFVALNGAPATEVLRNPVLIVVLPVWVVLNKLLGLYDRDANVIHKSTLDELPKILHSITLGSLLLFLLLPPVAGSDIEREFVLAFWLVALVATSIGRGVARSVVRRAFAPERTLIVGSGMVAGVVSRKLAMHPEYGVELVGFVDVDEGAPGFGPADPGLPLLGSTDDFEDICQTHNVERVVVAFSSLSHEVLLNLIRVSKRARIKITIVPRLFEVIGHRVEIDEVEGMTLLGLRSLNRAYSSLLLKRAIDVVGASLVLFLTAPLLAAIAIAIKLTSRGPVLYAQRRMGRGNKPFTMLKFRTMVVGAEQMKPSLSHLNEADGVMFKIAEDPRITGVGRWLRRMSLDELPQLINVLRGEMSLVGPRPLVPAENAHVIGWHRARLDLVPGLTGPWQVMGRTSIPFQEMVKMDYLYVAEWSLWNDIRLLLRTLPVVVFGRGH